MNRDEYIENVLEELAENKLSREKAEAMLTSVEVTDPAGEIDLHFAAAKAVQRYSVLTQVSNIHKEYAKAAGNNTTGDTAVIRPLTRKPVKWIMGIAASVLLTIGCWFIYQYTTTSSAALYSEIYQPYNVNTDRSITEVTAHTMVEDFKLNNYAAVIKTFSTLTASTNREKFLTAYAYHETGDYKNSLTLLLQILEYNKQNNSKLYNDEAEFYAGLCHLKLKEPEAALVFFKAIKQNPNHTFNERISKWAITRIKWLN
jgi:tetratricopeptide (TPR) repeat protein